MKKFLLAILPLAILASCGANKERKLLIVAPGSITADATGKNISVGDTASGAENKEIDLKDASVTSINLDNNGAKGTINVPADAGYYIYNAGKTIFGKLFVAGKDYNVGHDLDLDEQKLLIDSLKKILAGTGISAANKTYLINTGQITKISDDCAHTYVYAPFVTPSDIAQSTDGKPMMLYKFYTLDELQQRLQSVEDSYNAEPAK